MPIRGRPSLAEFFEANIASVWRVLRGLGVAEVDLACACQEVFVAAHRQWTDAGGREQMRARLCGFCVRTALAYRRRPGGRRDLACEAHAAPAATGEVARATLYRILDGLDDDRRAAFVLHDIEELTLADVAAILGCSPPIARARLQAARGAVEGAVVQGSLPGERAPAVTRSGLLASRT